MKKLEKGDKEKIKQLYNIHMINSICLSFLKRMQHAQTKLVIFQAFGNLRSQRKVVSSLRLCLNLVQLKSMI